MGLFKRKQSAMSSNYCISCVMLRKLFYDENILEELFSDNIEYARALLFTSLKMAREYGVRIPLSYKFLPITFVTNEDKSIYGYIIEFNDATFECECNYIAMMIVNGEKAFFTSEYYASCNNFGLCKFLKSGTHCCMVGDTNTFDEFKNVVLQG